MAGTQSCDEGSGLDAGALEILEFECLNADDSRNCLAHVAFHVHKAHHECNAIRLISIVAYLPRPHPSPSLLPKPTAGYRPQEVNQMTHSGVRLDMARQVGRPLQTRKAGCEPELKPPAAPTIAISVAAHIAERDDETIDSPLDGYLIVDVDPETL